MIKIQEVTPVFQVKNVQASVDFYRDKLGFRARHQNGDDMAIVERDGTDIILTKADDESWRTRDTFLQRPVASGAESFLPGTGSCRIQVVGVDELFAAYGAQGAIHRNGRSKINRGECATSPSGISTATLCRSSSAWIVLICRVR